MSKRASPPLPTEADALAGRAGLLALMLPEKRAEVEQHFADADIQEALQWKSPEHPNKTPGQLAAARRAASKAG